MRRNRQWSRAANLDFEFGLYEFVNFCDKSLRNALAKYPNYIRLETICPKDIAGAKNVDIICISLTLKTHLQIIFTGIKHMQILKYPNYICYPVPYDTHVCT